MSIQVKEFVGQTPPEQMRTTTKQSYKKPERIKVLSHCVFHQIEMMWRGAEQVAANE